MAPDDSNEKYDEQIEKKKAASLEIQLFQAAMKKDVKAFRIELQKALENALVRENICNASSRIGNSLLHIAAKFGNGEIVKVMADHEDLRFMLATRNSNGDTVLHIALRAEDESVFNVLKDIRKKYNDKYSQDEESGDTSWKDVSLTVTNHSGNTVLHEALIHRRKRMAEDLMALYKPDDFFATNKDKKSALYLSVEAGYLGCVKHMLENVEDKKSTYMNLKKGKSVIHAAVEGEHTEISSFLFKQLRKLKYVKDEEGRSPLHIAASIGTLQITRNLLELCHGYGVDETDENGMMPIHYAAKNNCVDVMKELLRHYHDPCELVNKQGENILHVAAKYGRYKTVSYILRSPALKMLLNQVDGEGNTPLHLASINCRPRIVSALTWENRVKVEAQNTKGDSALDVIGSSGSASDQVFKQMLTWAALKAAKTPKFNVSSQEKQDENATGTFKDRVNNLLLVSTLVVTVTFAAGFTMPGAYNSSDAKVDPGMAINLKHVTFQAFVICNTVAMYMAMLVVVVLMWAQLGDIRMMRASLQFALPFLGSALSMMCVAFMTGVYVTVSRLWWISKFILIFGCSFLVAIAGLIFLLGFPAESNKRCIRFLTYYLIYAMLRITGNISESRLET